MYNIRFIGGNKDRGLCNNHNVSCKIRGSMQSLFSQKKNIHWSHRSLHGKRQVRWPAQGDIRYQPPESNRWFLRRTNSGTVFLVNVKPHLCHALVSCFSWTVTHECTLYLQGMGGAVQYPKNYLKEAYRLVRERGGVCIADEVRDTV